MVSFLNWFYEVPDPSLRVQTNGKNESKGVLDHSELLSKRNFFYPQE
tara:strand:+ start:452 stop:592 length:141 start_codon:yes stop_codon:yes gene_type:complete